MFVKSLNLFSFTSWLNFTGEYVICNFCEMYTLQGVRLLQIILGSLIVYRTLAANKVVHYKGA